MTSRPPTLGALQNVPWLRDVSAHQLAVLANHTTQVELQAGQQVDAPAHPATAWVLSGEVEFDAGTTKVTRAGTGSLLCPSALWASQPTFPATHATLPSSLAWLERPRFDRIATEEPALALHLLRVALGSNGAATVPSLSGQVTASLPEGARVVPMGTQLRHLLPQEVDGLPVVAALVDRKAVALCAPLMTNARVAPLTPAHWEGQRIQRRSYALLTLEAARDIAPDLDVRMGPSVGFGQRVLVNGMRGKALQQFAERLELRLAQLVDSDLALQQRLWPYDEALGHFQDNGWHEAARLLGTWRDTAVPIVSYGRVHAVEMGPLLPSTAMFGQAHLLADDDFLLLVYGHHAPNAARAAKTMPALALRDVGEARRARPGQRTQGFLLREARSAAGSGYEVTFEEQSWLRALGVSGVGSFNHACVRGNVPDLIRVSEGFQEKKLTTIADEILRRSGEIDIVCIAGPSSSGKTTFIRRLCVQLQVNGITPVALGLDDYYVDREQSPRDATGDYDFEALQAIRLELLHEHVVELLQGKSVTTPRYDFKQGKSSMDTGQRIQLAERDVLLVEGIHGLNPELLGDVADTRVFRIFVCPLMQLSFDHVSRIHASDLRLIRRIVRDRHARGHDAAQTITRWPKVRAGERRHIYPYQSHADAVFDSSLVYELSVLRVYAERYLLEIGRDDPAYTTGFRLMQLLDRFVSIYPDHVPATSILREFIGGSGFDY